MTPPNRFWPVYDDQEVEVEVEIYTIPFWGWRSSTRQPRNKVRPAPNRTPESSAEARA